MRIVEADAVSSRHLRKPGLHQALSRTAGHSGKQLSEAVPFDFRILDDLDRERPV